jgi:hypothetical protein
MHNIYTTHTSSPSVWKVMSLSPLCFVVLASSSSSRFVLQVVEWGIGERQREEEWRGIRRERSKERSGIEDR